MGMGGGWEQLDPVHRAAALDYLGSREEAVGNVALIDNRLPPPPAGWNCSERAADTGAFDCDPGRVVAGLAPRRVPTIAVSGLHFDYDDQKSVFRAVDLTLERAQAYRVAGPNVADKTTLLKLLVGLLAPKAGTLTLIGEPSRPSRH